MKQIEEAVKYFSEENFIEAEKLSLGILFKNPEDNDAIDVLAAIFIRTGHLVFLETVTKKNIAILIALGKFLYNLKTFEHALVIFKKIQELDKRDYNNLNNLGLTYENLDMNEEALQAFEKSIKITPSYPAIYNLGVLHRENKNIEKSLLYLKRALQLNPQDVYAHYSLGMTYLINKDFENGYKYFVKRPIDGIQNLKNDWDKKAHPDKDILVFCEYGLGDALMFSRYFSLLKPLFKTVKVCCHSALHTLFRNSFSDIEFVSSFETTTYDYSVCAMNLPYYLNLDFDNIPVSEGYLVADEEKIQEFKNKYFDTNKLKVGIFYIGGEQNKRNARHRAIELRQLAPLLTLDNIQLYSFQKDDLLEELKEFPQIIDLGKTFNDFSDTAAAMKNLDIMVTIDSSPAHLAGALGVKTLLLLPLFSEWRWFTDETQTPWYNSVELIRQTALANWTSAVEKVCKKLNDYSSI